MHIQLNIHNYQFYLSAERAMREIRQSKICPKRCIHEKFSFTKVNMGTNFMSAVNKTSFMAQFNKPYVTIEEEYLLFDTVAIISATGGSLGLFLGLSCYSTILTGFEWLKEAFIRFTKR